MNLGLMVSLRDYDKFSGCNADFSELLLFESDLPGVDESITARLIQSASPRIEFVHSQEFMIADGVKRLVDLASEHPKIRSESVKVVRAARDLAKAIDAKYVVVHPGGIRESPADKTTFLNNLKESLSELGSDMLLLENMPWFYWVGQKRMISNICVSIEDMKTVESSVDGFVLDMCHGYLSRREGNSSFNESFLDAFGQRVRHIHASDAKIPDKEGLQIGEGEVDFSVLRGTDIPVLVEIWNGHADDGAGFKQGIEKLRRL